MGNPGVTAESEEEYIMWIKYLNLYHLNKTATETINNNLKLLTQ